MKLLALVALFGTASTYRLRHSFVRELPSWNDAKREIVKEVERDGSLTMEELHHGLELWEEHTGKTITDDEWEMVEAGFAEVDGDGDGHVTMDELKAAMKKHGGKKGVKDISVKDIRRLIKVSEPELTEEQIADIEAYLTEAFADDGHLDWEEAVKGIELWEKKYGKIPGEWKKALKKAFEETDTNDDGKISVKELEAAIEKH